MILVEIRWSLKMNLNKTLEYAKFDNMQGDSLVLKQEKDEISHPLHVPSDKVDYQSQIRIDSNVLIS